MSNTNVTRAIFTGFLYSLPEKIISDIFVPERSDFTLCSPNTQRIASFTLLFTASVWSNYTCNILIKLNHCFVRKKLLKPCNSIRFKNIKTLHSNCIIIPKNTRKIYLVSISRLCIIDYYVIVCI